MEAIATTTSSIAESLRGCSIELNPTESRAVDAAVNRLDPGTEVFLAWVPGSNPSDMILPAAKLHHAGLVPVPHIGARHLQSRIQLEQLTGRLAGEAGVDRVLVIGGDRDRPAGPYDSSLALLQTGLLQRAGIMRVAMAGFPEGNPSVPDLVLSEVLTAKIGFAQGAGLQVSIVTQFCFEAKPIVEWLRHIRNHGIDVPVRIGVAGPAGLLSLTRYAVRCGVSNSLKVLMEKPAFAKLLVDKGPEPIIRDVAAGSNAGAVAGLPPGVAGFHLFAFGGFNKTAAWIHSYRAQ